MNKQRWHWVFFLLFTTLLGVLFVVDILLGSVKIPGSEITRILFSGRSYRPEWATIILDFRIPKALTAVMAGMALSVGGLQMQTIFRNPLAGPDVLGISSGASLGVAILVLGFSSYYSIEKISCFGNWTIAMAAWAGSAFILFLIFMVSIRIRDIMTILILGILFASVISSLVSILQYFSSESMLKSFVVWTMGSLGSVTGAELYVLIPCVATGLIIALVSSKYLNALLLGDHYARTIGLNIRFSRFVIFISTSILTGSVTAFCGPIGFIGIAVPHLSRMIFRVADHWILIFASSLIGANVMLISDIISQLPGTGMTLPVNSVTAILGIPIVIWIVIKNYKMSVYS